MPIGLASNFIMQLTQNSVDGTQAVPVYASAVVAYAESLGASFSAGNRATDPLFTPAVISGITQANPGVITTAAAHGLLQNDLVYIASVVGMTQLNVRSYLVATVPSTTTLTLQTYAATTGSYKTYTPVNTSGYTAYTSGGTISRLSRSITMGGAGNGMYLQILAGSGTAGTGAWLCWDQECTFNWRGTVAMQPGAESATNAGDGGNTCFHYESRIVVDTTSFITDNGGGGAVSNGGQFITLRTPHGVNPEIIHDGGGTTAGPIRHDYPTLNAGIAPSGYRIEGFNVYSTGDSRKWYVGNSRNTYGTDEVNFLDLSGGGEVFQVSATAGGTTVLNSPIIPNMQIGGDSQASNINIVSATLGTEITGALASTNLFPITLRLGRQWLTDPNFSGQWNGVIQTPNDWTSPAYMGVRYTNTLNMLYNGAAVTTGVQVQWTRAVRTAGGGYATFLAAAPYLPEVVQPSLTTGVSGQAVHVCTDTFIGNGESGTTSSAYENYTWTCIARAYSYVTPANNVYTARIYGFGGTLTPVVDTVSLSAVSNLALTSTQAAALTGIAFVASGAAGGTVTVSTNHSVSDIWAAYRYWISTIANFGSNDTWTYDGTTLNMGAWSITTSATISGNFTTSGTSATTGAGAYTGIYTSSAGTSAQLVISGLIAGTSVYVQNAAGAQQVYVTGQSGTYTLNLPPGSSAGSWTWAVKALGYASATGTFIPSSGGLFSVTPSTPQKQLASGGAMYAGSVSALVTITFTGTTEADVVIGNGAITVQNAFDASENALVTTAAGMAWLAGGLGELSEFLSAAGNFLFMTTKWRLKALNTSSPNATLSGFPQSVDGTPVNAVNGNIIVLSNPSAATIAAAVWAATQGVSVFNNTGLIPALL